MASTMKLKTKRKTFVPAKPKRSYLPSAQAVADLEETETALYYGRSGTGKTTLASTYPKPTILLDFNDKGTRSVRNVKGIKVIRMEDWDFVEGVYWDLNGGKHDYKSVILDTIDGMQSLAMAKVRQDNNKAETEAMSQRDWGELANLMNQWLFSYRDLPLNVVFLSHERIRNADDENSGADAGQLEPEVGPSVIPSVARGLTAAVNTIGQTYIRQVKKREDNKTKTITSFMLRLGPHPFYITKIRKPREFIVPSSIINPTYEKVMKITRGEKL